MQIFAEQSLSSESNKTTTTWQYDFEEFSATLYVKLFKLNKKMQFKKAGGNSNVVVYNY